MKLLDNRVGPKSRPTRLSTEGLQNSNRITFRLYDRAWFKDLIKETWDHRFLRSDYENWLNTKRLTHRLATRLRYKKSPEDKETNSELVRIPRPWRLYPLCSVPHRMANELFVHDALASDR